MRACLLLIEVRVIDEPEKSIKWTEPDEEEAFLIHHVCSTPSSGCLQLIDLMIVFMAIVRVGISLLPLVALCTMEDCFAIPPTVDLDNFRFYFDSPQIRITQQPFNIRSERESILKEIQSFSRSYIARN